MSLNKHQFKTYYHGTRFENVDSIQKEGLKAKQWHPQGAPKGVYMGGLETAEAFGSGEAVFAIDLPESQVHPIGIRGDWVMVNHDISPFALKRVK
jgi:hypothetical protein